MRLADSQVGRDGITQGSNAIGPFKLDVLVVLASFDWLFRSLELMVINIKQCLSTVLVLRQQGTFVPKFGPKRNNFIGKCSSCSNDKIMFIILRSIISTPMSDSLQNLPRISTFLLFSHN